MKQERIPPRMVLIVPRLAVPEYMGFLLEYCEPTRYTRKAVEAGHLLRIDYHPPYLQLSCSNPDKVIEKARRRGLRVYWGKKHVTITDGVIRLGYICTRIKRRALH